jgi:hypothetical protein
VTTRCDEEDYETAQTCAPSRQIDLDKGKNIEVLSSQPCTDKNRCYVNPVGITWKKPHRYVVFLY